MLLTSSFGSCCLYSLCNFTMLIPLQDICKLGKGSTSHKYLFKLSRNQSELCGGINHWGTRKKSEC